MTQDETTTVIGRSNAPRIDVRDPYGRDPLFVVRGGEVRAYDHPKGRFSVQARHESATDFEHDAAYVLNLEGYGLNFDHMYGNLIYLSGVIMEARYYDADQSFEPGTAMPHSRDDEIIRVCEDTESYHKPGSDWPTGHLFLPYQPPQREWTPRPVEIIVYVAGGDDE